YLGRYNQGLGVTSTGENGDSPSHTVDNHTNTDFVVFQFNQQVRLTQAMLNLFTDGSYFPDGDVTIGYFNTNYCTDQMTQNGCLPIGTSSPDFSSLHITTITKLDNGTSSSETLDFDLGDDAYANSWIIMAGLGDAGDDWYNIFGGYDDFK